MRTDVTPPVVGLISCSVFEQELECLWTTVPRPSVVRWLDMALHDRPDELRAALQHALEEVEGHDGLDAVVVLYGLCGLGSTGLAPKRYPLVFPRAHDCITVFFGSKERHQEHQRACPGCYYYTPGWNRARRVPGPDQLAALASEYARSFEPEDVEFLLESERAAWAMHDTAVFLDLGTPVAGGERDYARGCAEFLGWKFQEMAGDVRLLRDLLTGAWDEDRFQQVKPGEMLAHRADEQLMTAIPAAAVATASTTFIPP